MTVCLVYNMTDISSCLHFGFLLCESSLLNCRCQDLANYRKLTLYGTRMGHSKRDRDVPIP